MPARAVTLPTPEQERKAILAVIAFGVLAVIGIVSLVCGAVLALIGIARLFAGWVFG